MKKFICLDEVDADLSLPMDHIMENWKANRACPRCGLRGVWRQGIYFDHEMRCVPCSLEDKCIVWEPGKEYQRIFQVTY